MILLAIETSHEPGSIALLRDGECLEEVGLHAAKRRGQNLIFEIQQLFSRHTTSPEETGKVAVTIGPGSFTGLRVGVVAAKTVGYLCNCPISAIPTHRAIVENLGSEIQTAEVAVDAQRREIFLQRFESDSEGIWKPVSQIEIRGVDEWFGSVSPEAVVVGPGLNLVREALPGGWPAMAESDWFPRAGTLGRLATNSEWDTSPWELSPLYVRKSAAEEKREQLQPGITSEDSKSG